MARILAPCRTCNDGVWMGEWLWVVMVRLVQYGGNFSVGAHHDKGR